ncbi:hypothetical protein DFH11DRAFT_1645277 [Phellopilus nigrolimitatus]|nr:hypothetical protein DFH11DRAFT_1645277 [Phellopilus nigrolimitatus]
MEKEVAQLVEMGATMAQARAALRKYKDVMQAAERIFDGEFADLMDDDVQDTDVVAKPAGRAERPRMITPHDDEDSDPEDGDEIELDDTDDGDDDFVDYDSDYSAKAEQCRAPTTAVDPYAGIFFSKDRREEVIEVEEEPETVTVPGCADALKLMTQGQWMKGCPEGSEQSFLFSIYAGLSEGSCICPEGCGHSVPRRKEDFFAVYPEFSMYITHLKQIVRKQCPNCSSNFCFACGEPVTAERDHTGRLTLDENPLFHCANMQGVILGVGLSMLEQMFAEQVSHASGSEGSGNSKKRKAQTPTTAQTADPDDDDEDYYATVTKGKKVKGGIGYAGNLREDHSGQLEALAIQKTKDEKIGNILKDIREFLPNLHREEGGKTSDYLPHPTTLAHLRRKFNYVSSTLLRNDSLSDMSDRSVLYFELFEWLETISNHEALASMMAMPIMVVASIKSVNTKKTGGRSQIRERTIIYEGSSGPRELLEAIVIQAQAASKGLEGSKPVELVPEEMTEEQKRMTGTDFNGKGKGRQILGDTNASAVAENVRLLDFCNRIMSTAAAIDRSLRETKGDAFLQRLKMALPKVPTSIADAAASKGVEHVVDAGMTDEQLQKIYMDWATRVRFEYCDLTVPLPEGAKIDDDWSPTYKHHFNNEVRTLANSDIPRRALAIAKELAVLTTNLPVAWDSSIFLRVDESRVDVIKALITGPKGTPYYNGCYLFDIFLGPGYNQSPPSVKYMTTNNGRYRFNPNLYADGKVCLSLLGTWSGPGWVSGKSTLLQVLISIQSMILCDEPYLNEPGWAGEAGTPASKAYTANVKRMVVNTAMLGNLKNPPEPFEDVIRTHFRLKARSISIQLDEWLAQDDARAISSDGGGYGSKSLANPASGSGDAFKRDVDELKKLLMQLQVEDPTAGSSSDSA